MQERPRAPSREEPRALPNLLPHLVSISSVIVKQPGAGASHVGESAEFDWHSVKQPPAKMECDEYSPDEPSSALRSVLDCWSLVP